MTSNESYLGIHALAAALSHTDPGLGYVTHYGRGDINKHGKSMAN